MTPAERILAFLEDTDLRVNCMCVEYEKALYHAVRELEHAVKGCQPSCVSECTRVLTEIASLLGCEEKKS